MTGSQIQSPHVSTQLGHVHVAPPLFRLGAHVGVRPRQAVFAGDNSQRPMDIRTWDPGSSILSSQLQQCNQESTRSHGESSPRIGFRSSGRSQPCQLLKCGRSDSEIKLLRVPKDNRSQSPARPLNKRLRAGQAFQISDFRPGHVDDVTRRIHDDSRYSTRISTHCNNTSGLGFTKLFCRPKVLSRPLLVLRSKDSTGGLHKVYTSSDRDDEQVGIHESDGVSGRVFHGGKLVTCLGHVVYSGGLVDKSGVLYPPRQDGTSGKGGQVSRFHSGCLTNEIAGTSGQVGRCQVSHQASLLQNVVASQNLGKVSGETQFHSKSHIWWKDISQEGDRPSGASKATGKKGFQNNQVRGSRPSLVAPIHGALEWRSTDIGRPENLILQLDFRCIERRSRSSIGQICNLSSSHSKTKEMAHQREGAVRFSRGDARMGLQVSQEACQVLPTSWSRTGQYHCHSLDKQRYIKEQSSNGNVKGTVLDICNTRIQDHLCTHPGRAECDSRRSIKVRILAHPKQLCDQEVSGAITSGERLHKEAQFYLNSSLSTSSKPGKVSQMRSYVRFAIIMNTQPICPSEEFLIKYACFLARTLPLTSIWGYLHAIHVLHKWWSIDFNCSKSTCPKLHLILDGIGSAGIQPALRKKAAFGLKELLSLKGFCFQHSAGSLQRTAWVAIIVCFWACLRSDNVVPKTAKSFDPLRHICSSNMQRIPEGILVSLAKTKTRSSQKAKLKILLTRLDSLVDLCPVRAIDMLLASVPGLDSGPLFMFLSVDGAKLLLYRDLRMVINNWAKACGIDPRMYGSQSARSGSATTAYRGGVDYVGIRKLGDWLSNVFLSYIKTDVVDLLKIQMQMLNELTSQAVI